MKDCLTYAPMISARQGELEGAEDAALARHLAGCADCRARKAGGEVLSTLLSPALLAEANHRDFHGFADSVMARLPAQVAATRRPRRRWNVAAGIIAPALAAAAAIFFYVRVQDIDEVAQAGDVEVDSAG